MPSEQYTPEKMERNFQEIKSKNPDKTDTWVLSHFNEVPTDVWLEWWHKYYPPNNQVINQDSRS